jgi:hypothetical protein
MERLKEIFYSLNTIQGDSEGKANILGRDNIGHCEKKQLI